MEVCLDAANGASAAVARRAGLTETGRGPTPEGVTAPGEVGIEVVWRVTADGWAAGH
ncbi:hypothetical protein [Streptomyces marokkonensis]|uniref:hypothetical protein n=1 Tax=Streptomyces marokkonensis TaxID=324855 RepID=UPI00142ED382|nr:hypothetical protein [Streptomyces marokkonensis]